MPDRDIRTGDGTILKRSVDAKKLVQIGKAKINKDDCIVVSGKKNCTASSERCPTKAVYTISYESVFLLPVRIG